MHNRLLLTPGLVIDIHLSKTGLYKSLKWIRNSFANWVVLLKWLLIFQKIFIAYSGSLQHEYHQDIMEIYETGYRWNIVAINKYFGSFIQRV